MKTCNFLEEYLNDEILSRIYRNDCNFTEQMIVTDEYIEVIQALKKQERKLVELEEFKRYL